MTKAGSTEKVVGEIRRHTRRRFSRLGPDARFHTVQAMRANWFIGRALNRNPNAFSAGVLVATVNFPFVATENRTL